MRVVRAETCFNNAVIEIRKVKKRKHKTMKAYRVDVVLLVVAMIAVAVAWYL